MLTLGIFILNLYISCSVFAVNPLKQQNCCQQSHQASLETSARANNIRYGFANNQQESSGRRSMRQTSNQLGSQSKQTNIVNNYNHHHHHQDLLSRRSILSSSKFLSNASIIENDDINQLLNNKSDSNFVSNELNLSDNLDNNNPIDVTKDDSNKIKMHTNNHQQNGVSRHYSANYHNKYNANSYGNNLNYIHNLFATSGKNHNHPGALTSLLKSNSYGLAMPNSYPANDYYSLASSLSSNGYNSIQGDNININPSLSNQQENVIFDQPATNNDRLQLNSSNLSSNDDQNSYYDTSTHHHHHHHHCGRQQVGNREPRIVGGNTSSPGEHPWAVSIQRHGNHHCGGVIVGKRWILTAAHCVRSQLVGNLLVRTGGQTLSRSVNSINSHLERDYFVEQIVMHGDFSRYDNLTTSQVKSSVNTNNADIALLRLRNDIAWNEYAWPVCFPHRDSGNFSGHDAIVIGWGKLSEKSEDFSNELQKVKLTIIDNKLCQNWFRQAGREMPIDDRIICAGFKNGGKDACHGDSGGPLLSKINGNYVVVGVVSTGIGCARPLLPGLYSRVSSYIGWIERIVNQQ